MNYRYGFEANRKNNKDKCQPGIFDEDEKHTAHKQQSKGELFAC